MKTMNSINKGMLKLYMCIRAFIFPSRWSFEPCGGYEPANPIHKTALISGLAQYIFPRFLQALYPFIDKREWKDEQLGLRVEMVTDCPGYGFIAGRTVLTTTEAI